MFKSALQKELVIASLSDEETSALEAIATATKYEKGQVIFYEDRMPFGIFILEQGKVKLYKTGENGKKQIFQICRGGDIFGFHAVLNDYAYPDSAAALEDSEILFIPKQFFIDLVKQNSTLSFTLLQALSEEFRKFIDQETMFTTKTVRERVALVLYMLHELYQTDGNKVVITLSRSDLADLCGTVKETLVRTLHEFKQDKLIQAVSIKDLEILNLKELKKIADYY